MTANLHFKPEAENLETEKGTYFTSSEIRELFRLVNPHFKVRKAALASLNKILASYGFDIVRRAIMNAKQHTKPDQALELTADMIKQAQVELEHASTNPSRSSTTPFFHYCWIIHENGSCLFSKSYSGMRFPDTLFSGLIIGIIDVMYEVTGRFPTFIQLGNLAMHIQRFGILTAVIISDSGQATHVNNLTKEIGRKFYQKYERYLEKEDIYDLSTFESFAEDLDLIVKQGGLALPQHVAFEADDAQVLSPEQIEDTVAAAALREEILKATQQIRQLPIFKSHASSEAQAIEQQLPAAARASSKVIRKLNPERIKKAVNEDMQKAEKAHVTGSQELDQQLDADLQRLQREKETKCT